MAHNANRKGAHTRLKFMRTVNTHGKHNKCYTFQVWIQCVYLIIFIIFLCLFVSMSLSHQLRPTHFLYLKHMPSHNPYKENRCTKQQNSHRVRRRVFCYYFACRRAAELFFKLPFKREAFTILVAKSKNTLHQRLTRSRYATDVRNVPTLPHLFTLFLSLRRSFIVLCSLATS